MDALPWVMPLESQAYSGANEVDVGQNEANANADTKELGQGELS